MIDKNNSLCFLSLDVGTTAVKIALFNSSGDLLALSVKEYSLYTPSENIVEMDPEKYWECCKSGIKEILVISKISLERIKSISVSSQCETLIVLDKKGNPIRNAIVWLDNRSDKESEEIKRVFGNDIRTGQVDVYPTWPVTKILWIKKNEPNIFRRIHYYMMVEDYIVYQLTKKVKGEYSLYSSSYMLDVINKKWWKDILDYVGIDINQLVELCESGEIIGSITVPVSKELGLNPDTLVISGAMDQAASMIGTGNINAGSVTEGTGAVLAVCGTLDKFPGKNVISMAIQNHAIPDKYLTIGWCPVGGLALKWLRDTFFESERDEAFSKNIDSYELLTAMAEKIPIGCQGLLFFPYMSGPGTLNINPKTRGAFYGLELHHKKEHFIRAVMESIAFVLRKILQDIENIGGSCNEIFSIGGASKSKFWNQIKADVTGKTITTMKCSEAASLGVAVLQAKALNVYPDIEKCVKNMVHSISVTHPIKENQIKYESIFQTFVNIEK